MGLYENGGMRPDETLGDLGEIANMNEARDAKREGRATETVDQLLHKRDQLQYRLDQGQVSEADMAEVQAELAALNEQIAALEQAEV